MSYKYSCTCLDENGKEIHGMFSENWKNPQQMIDGAFEDSRVKSVRVWRET